MPDHGDFEHPHDYGCVHKDFVDLAPEDEASWLELAVLTSFKYAKQAVVIVSPVGVVLPQYLLDHPVCRGKTAHFVPLGSFSRNERDKLATHYRFIDESGGRNSIDYYISIMRRYWS